MQDPKIQSVAIQPTPLSRNEVAVLAGAGMVVFGTWLPAINSRFSSAQTLVESGNTAAVVLWALAGAALWKVVTRQAHLAGRMGLFSLLFLAVYGIFLWIEEVREPISTLFGTVHSSFKASAWVVIAAGALVMTVFSRLEVQNRSSSSNATLQPPAETRAIGASLAILACLLGIAFVNPFNVMSPSEFDRNWHAYADEIHMFRWLLLCSAASAIVASFQYPHQSIHILRPAIRISGWLIGICLILLTSLVAPEVWLGSVVVAIVWAIASIMFYAASHSQPLARWQLLIVYSPFVAVFTLLTISGEIGDAMLIFVPAMAALAGYIICRNNSYSSTTMILAGVTFGVPVAWMAFMGVPNEFAEASGMAKAESRAILLGVFTALAYGAYTQLVTKQFTASAPPSTTPNAVNEFSESSS